MPSRRALLAAGVGLVAGLGGCTNRGSDTPSGTTSDESTEQSPGAGPTTRTPRNPRSLDVGGAWRQRGYDSGHSGVTRATGTPADRAAYWHLPRIRSGPPLLSDGRLFHFGRVGENPEATPTRTETPPTGTGHQPEGRLALLCRDARTGRRLWTRTLTGQTRTGVVAAGGPVVAGEGFLAGYRASDGRERWRRDLADRQVRVTTAVDGVVFATTELPRQTDRKADVRAYDADDGTLRWNRPSPKWQASLAAVGDTLLALSSEFEVGSVLTARSVGNGSEQWSVELDHNGLPAGPYATSETVYVAPDDGGVYAFDRSNGGRRWHYEAETSNVVGVAVAESRAYLVDEGRLRVVDAADGREAFSTSPDGDRGYNGPPSVGSDAVYLEKSGYPADFAAVSRSDGSERWSFELPTATVEGDMVMSGLASRPVIAEGGVYAYAVDGLYAFGPA